MNSINSITFYNILSTIILQGIALFTSPLFSRMLGAENYGIVSVYNTWISIIVVIFGIQTQSTIAVARTDFSENEQKKYQSSIYCLSCIIYLLFSILMLVFINPLSNLMEMSKTMYILMLLHGFGFFTINFINIKFTYEFKAKYNFILSCVLTVLNVGLSLIFISFLPRRVNYWGRISAQAFVYILIGSAVGIYLLNLSKCHISKKYWKYCIPLAIPIVFHNLAGLILNQSDRLMLQKLESSSVVGIYSLSYSFGSILSVIWNALNNSWVPFYYELTKRQKDIEIMYHSKNYLNLFTIISSGFVLLTPEVYKIFASKEYWGGLNLIPIFAIGFYFIFIYSFFVNYEFYNKKTNIIAVGTSLAAICNIILNIIMIRYWKMSGAALATAISYFFQLIFHIICVKIIRKKSEVVFPYRISFFIPYIILFMSICMLCILIGDDFVCIRWGGAILLGIYAFYKIYKNKSIF